VIGKLDGAFGAGGSRAPLFSAGGGDATDSIECKIPGDKFDALKRLRLSIICGEIQSGTIHKISGLRVCLEGGQLQDMRTVPSSRKLLSLNFLKLFSGTANFSSFIDSTSSNGIHDSSLSVNMVLSSLNL
jgi:hypothetical protein